MTIELEKNEIIKTIIESFQEEGITINPSDIKSLENNKVWELWVYQEKGLDTSEYKILIPLEQLADGINFVLAVGNWVKAWAHPLNGYFKDEIPKHLMDEERLNLFKDEWVGKMVRLPQHGEGPVLDADYHGRLTVAITGPNMLTTKQIHHSKVGKI